MKASRGVNRTKLTQSREASRNDTESLAHTRWECEYHIVWIPKGRRKVLYAQLRRQLGGVPQELARQRECTVEEGHLLPDHAHELMSSPPRYGVAQVVG
ncbi:MAG: transposase [Betaproteobacteria bacterium RIFCSPLOWO2_12_FULL_62_13b]|nr:MAG: transposase [Betaproteobacteria bacterium RIFCSPLOWO2_12_FULL_62_13b]